jgi:hypothetical protein
MNPKLQSSFRFNPLNAELNPICHLLALLGAHHILHVSRIRLKYGVASQTVTIIIVTIVWQLKQKHLDKDEIA